MNILGIGPFELVLIGALIFMLFGPQELPRIMGQIGRVYREIQQATSGLSEEFTRTLQAEIDSASQVAKDTQQTLTQAVSLEPAPTPAEAAPIPYVPPVAEPTPVVAAVGSAYEPAIAPLAPAPAPPSTNGAHHRPNPREIFEPPY